METLEQKFNEELKAWKEHSNLPRIQIDSSMHRLIDCQPYRNIVAMGRDALPMLRNVYDNNSKLLNTIKYHGIPIAVSQILGESYIPESIRGNMSAIAEYTKAFLDLSLEDFKS